MRGISTRHTTRHQSLFPAVISSVLAPLFSMDSSSRNHMPAPPTSRSTQQRPPEPEATTAPGSARKVNGRVDQLALVQSSLQNGATPTLDTGFAKIIAQMQTQAIHPHVVLAITSSIGSLERSVSFRDGTWHGYDPTHVLIDPRSHQSFGEPTRPPMDPECSLRMFPPTMQPLSYQPPTPPPPPHGILPTPTSLEQPRFSCTLSPVPPQILIRLCHWHPRE